MENTVTIGLEEFDRMRDFAKKWQEDRLPVAILDTSSEVYFYHHRLEIYKRDEVLDMLAKKVTDLNKRNEELSIMSEGYLKELSELNEFSQVKNSRKQKIERDRKTLSLISVIGFILMSVCLVGMIFDHESLINFIAVGSYWAFLLYCMIVSRKIKR